MKPSPKPTLLLFVAGALFASCAVMKPVDLSSYPADMRKIYLHNFTNDTFQPDANGELTAALRHELDRRENFILVDDQDKARLMLYGAVTVFRKEGRMYDNYRNPVRYELIISARIKLRERNTSDSSSGGYIYTGDVGARVDYSNREGFIESEIEARQRLYRLLASRIHNLLDQEYINHYGTPAP